MKKRSPSQATTQLSQTSQSSKKVKGYEKKKPYNAKPVRVYFGKQPFPKQLSNTLKYAETVSGTMALGLYTIQYSVNGLYDPRAAVGGHQPLYFDQLISIYNHYTVVRSRARFTPLIGNQTTNLACLHGVYIDDDTSFTISAEQAIERTLGHGGRVLAASPPNPAYLDITWNAADFFGKGTMADPSMQGDQSNNPSEQQYFTYSLTDPGRTALFGFNVLVELEYDVIWDEWKTIADS